MIGAISGEGTARSDRGSIRDKGRLRESGGAQDRGKPDHCVQKRHNWRKVMPRSKHPQKADEEEIEASKK